LPKVDIVYSYANFGPDLVEFISDTTPLKQGKFSPGAHIPVRPYAEFAARYPFGKPTDRWAKPRRGAA
jgi:methylation protein EvaC